MEKTLKKIIYLPVLGLSYSMWDPHSSLWCAGSFSCSIQTLSCSTWDLVHQLGIEFGSPALGAQSLSHWTTREVPNRTLYLSSKERKAEWSNERVIRRIRGLGSTLGPALMGELGHWTVAVRGSGFRPSSVTTMWSWANHLASLGLFGKMTV